MYKNYFFLNRLIIELNTNLKGFVLTEAYSQEKDKLVLDFQNNNYHKYLLISVSQNLPFIQIRDDYNRAKKNTLDIFPGYLPMQFIDASIADNDRIIRFNFGTFNIYFFLRGKNTNVVLINDENKLSAFKKFNDNEQELINNFSKKKYITGFNIPDFIEGIDYNTISQELDTIYPNLGKDIKKEAVSRSGSSKPEEIIKSIKNVLQEIRDNKVVVFYDNFLNRFVLTVNSFKSFNCNTKAEFNSYLDALNYFLTQKYKYDRVLNLKKIISKNLDQQLARVSGKLNELSHKINEPSKEELYKHYGNLLLTNKYLIKKGLKEIEVPDFLEEGKIIKIKLDDALDGKGNIDRYFEKAKNERQSKISLSELFESLKRKYDDLLKLKNQFESAAKLDDYLTIMDKMNIKPEQGSQSRKDDTPNYKHYIIENKYHLFVGKDSHNNDELTTRFAKQNDYWFHARGVPGSHAVLRVDNTKEVIPKPVLKKAASIAAFHSKAKTSRLAPVAYTLKKYVTKRKGMEPGKVSLLKEDVLLVKPEIPENCEFISNE